MLKMVSPQHTSTYNRPSVRLSAGAFSVRRSAQRSTSNARSTYVRLITNITEGAPDHELTTGRAWPAFGRITFSPAPRRAVLSTRARTVLVLWLCLGWAGLGRLGRSSSRPRMLLTNTLGRHTRVTMCTVHRVPCNNINVYETLHSANK